MPRPNFDMPNLPDVEGNLYPRDGQSYDNADNYFDEPQERKEDEREETNEENYTVPFLTKIHAWFDDEIAAADSIENIKVESVTINGVVYSSAVSIEAQVLAFRLLKQKLQEKKDEFPDLEDLL